MSLTSRAAISIGGPSGGTIWVDLGFPYVLGSSGTNGPTTITATTTLPGDIVTQTVPRRNPAYLNVSQFTTNSDTINSTRLIQTLYGFIVSASALQAAIATLTLEMSVYRIVGQLSGTGAASATTVPLKLAISNTIPSGSTLTITKVDGSAATTLTTSAVAAPGNLSIAVSGTPNLSTYLDGSNIVWQVGGGPAFGWVGGSGGTPAFPKGCTVMAPIISTNTSLITLGATAWLGPNGLTTAQAGALPLEERDSIVLTCVTSTATQTVQVLNIQPLIT